jgi:hypothetical protein
VDGACVVLRCRCHAWCLLPAVAESDRHQRSGTGATDLIRLTSHHRAGARWMGGRAVASSGHGMEDHELESMVDGAEMIEAGMPKPGRPGVYKDRVAKE